MKVASLRAQVALAAVPWLEQVQSGEWRGNCITTADAAKAGWTGALEVHDAQISVPGLADPLELASAHAQIDGARVDLDRVQGAAGQGRLHRRIPLRAGGWRARTACACAPEKWTRPNWKPSCCPPCGAIPD